MGSSKRRRSLRQVWGVKLRSKPTRWIGRISAREMGGSGRSTDHPAYVKAGNGAERSFPDRGRRKRGQRRGKTRSRGGKPRRTSNPAALESRRSGWRVSYHNERLFAIMRRATERLMSRVEKAVAPNGFVCDLTGKRVRSHLYDIWVSQTRHFPASYRMTFFGRDIDEFIARLQVLLEESQPAPPPRLPPRPGAPKFPYRVRRPRSPPAPVVRVQDWLTPREALVPNSTLETHRKKDSLGPNPCEWCRAEWAADGEVGACLEIQFCVRSAESAANRERESASSRVKQRRRGRR